MMNVKNKYRELQGLSWGMKLAYASGHVYNDLCASIWFSYTLLYFKLSFDDATAGLLLLFGQAADALATPLIGYLSDKQVGIVQAYGRRKIWHLIGSVLVTCSFPLIFNSCILCSKSVASSEKFIYYALFIGLFQIGWASVQVAHLSLITDLSDSSNERVELNALRQVASVASSICVYSITLALLGVEDATLTQADSIVFMKVVHLITFIGIAFTILFHIFVKEPSPQPALELATVSRLVTSINNEEDIVHRKSSLLEVKLTIPSQEESSTKVFKSNRIWSDWFKSGNFWRVCMIYMLARLFFNVTQVYTPLYLQETLQLAKRNIAIVPFVTYFAGLLFSFAAKSNRINSQIIMYLGCFFGALTCFWIAFCGLEISIQSVYGMAAVFGIGANFLLIGSLSLTSDLIGDNKISGAFVYGSMSFFDKLVNGGVIALVQALKPQNDILATTSSSSNIVQNTTFLFKETSSKINTVFFNKTNHITNIDLNITPTVFYLDVLVYVGGAAIVIILLVMFISFFRKSNNN